MAINSIGRTFGLDGVCVLRRDGDSWSVEASVGRTTVLNPDSAPFGDEIASGRVLAMEGSRLTDLEVAALRSFLDQLRFARERALIEGIEGGQRYSRRIDPSVSTAAVRCWLPSRQLKRKFAELTPLKLCELLRRCRCSPRAAAVRPLRSVSSSGSRSAITGQSCRVTLPVCRVRPLATRGRHFDPEGLTPCVEHHVRDPVSQAGLRGRVVGHHQVFVPG